MRPPPPDGLQSGGRALWKRFTAEWEFDARELEVLRRCAALVDLEQALLRVVREEGAGTPATSKLLTAQALLVRTLAALSLPDAEVVKTPKQQRAERAADARWEHRREIRAVRESLDG